MTTLGKVSDMLILALVMIGGFVALLVIPDADDPRRRGARVRAR